MRHDDRPNPDLPAAASASSPAERLRPAASDKNAVAAAKSAGAHRAAKRVRPPAVASAVPVRRDRRTPVLNALMWAVSAGLFSAVGYVGWRVGVQGERVAVVVPFLALPEAPAAAASSGLPPAAAPVPGGAVGARPSVANACDGVGREGSPPESAAVKPAASEPQWHDLKPGEQPAREKDETVTLFGKRMPRRN